MSEMVEKVARAICLYELILGLPGTSAPDSEWQKRYVEERFRGYEGAARVAIAAMREPTEAMIDKGAFEVSDDWGDPNRIGAGDCWRTMIGVALGEE